MTAYGRRGEEKLMRRSIVWVLAVCSLCAAMVGCSEKKEATQTKTTTQKVSIGNLQVGLSADGKVSRPTTSLDFEVTGIVKSISIEVGQSVKQGDTLAVLDDTDLKLAVTNAQNALDKAKASYNDTVTQREYNIKSEKIKLQQMYDKYVAEFDDYSYQQSIASANTKLSRAIVSYQEALNALSNANAVYAQADSAYETALAQSTQLKEDGTPLVSPEELASFKKALDSAQSQYTEAAKKITSEQNAVADAQTALDNANRSLTTAQENFEKDKATRKQDYDLEKLKYDNLVKSTTSVTASELSVQEAENKLEEANNNLSKVALIAPVNGIVNTIAYKVGELVTGKTTSSGGSTSTTSAFISLRDPEAITLKANVTEGDITGIEVGQTMRVTVDALSAENLPGSVISISSLPRTDSSGIVTYEVIGQLNENDEAIKDGMNCFMTFLKKEKSNVLIVPVKAVFIEEGKQYVNVQLEDKTIEKRAVVCGLSNGVSTEIVSGLKEGETVVIGSAKKS